MAHQHYRTKGFVLSKKNSGEADQIFSLYTQDLGKIEVVGKSIRKITSKLKFGIDVFYFIEIEFIQGKRQKILTDAILLDKFSKARKNPEALRYVAQIAEAVGCLVLTEKEDEAIWNLLLKVIKRMNDLSFENSLPAHIATRSIAGGQIENCKLKIILNYFLWNFFSLLGYSPELYFCPICSKKLLPETFFLSPHHGGVVCWGCCDKTKKESQHFLFKEITVNTVKLIRFLIQNSIQKAQKLDTSQNDLESLNNAFELYFNFLNEK